MLLSVLSVSLAFISVSTLEMCSRSDLDTVIGTTERL